MEYMEKIRQLCDNDEDVIREAFGDYINVLCQYITVSDYFIYYSPGINGQYYQYATEEQLIDFSIYLEELNE